MDRKATPRPGDRMLLQKLSITSFFILLSWAASLESATATTQEMPGEINQRVDDFWQLIPENALGAFKLKRTEIREKLADSSLEEFDYKYPIPSYELPGGIDPDAPAIMFYTRSVFEVFVFQIEDRAELLSDLKLEVEYVEDGEVAEVNSLGGRNKKFCTIYLNHLYVSQSREALEEMLQANKLSETISADIQNDLANDDIVWFMDSSVIFFMNSKGSIDSWINLVKRTNGVTEDGSRQALEAFSRIGEIAEDLDFMVVGVDLEEGITGSVMFGLHGEHSSHFLRAFPAVFPDERPVRLVNQAANARLLGRVDAAASADDARLTLPLLQTALSTGVSPGFPSDRTKPSQLFCGHLRSIIEKFELQSCSTRSVLFLNDDPEAHGSSAYLIRLGTQDPNSLLDKLRSLDNFRDPGDLQPAEFLSLADPVNVQALIEALDSNDEQASEAARAKLQSLRYRVYQQVIAARFANGANRHLQELSNGLYSNHWPRIAAEFKIEAWQSIEPRFAIFSAQEHRQGVAIDWIKVQLTGDEALAVGDLESIFGPEWNVIRLIQIENEVWLFVGSNTQLLDELLAQRDVVPEYDSSYQRFMDRVDDPLMAEVEISFRNLGRLYDIERIDIFEKTRSPGYPDQLLHDLKRDWRVESESLNAEAGHQSSHLGMAVHPKLIRLDFHFPAEEVREAIKRAFLRPPLCPSGD